MRDVPRWEGLAGRSTPSLLGWRNLLVNDLEGFPVAVNRVPDEAFVHVADEDGVCMCGPNVTQTYQSHGAMAVVAHKPLDVRYYHEEWEDLDW